MPIPSSNETIDPMLQCLARTETPLKLANIIEKLAKHFSLTAEDMEEKDKNGKSRFRARVSTAIKKMKTLNLIKPGGHGYWEIADKGRERIGYAPQPVESPSDDNPPLADEVQDPKTDSIPKDDRIAEMTSQIITAHLSRTAVDTKDLPALIKGTYDALSGRKQPSSSASPPTSTAIFQSMQATPQEPAVPIEKSITDGYIICLEDGMKFKSLTRHLSSHYQMTPEQYRTKWGLPPDYPMVVKKISQKRSQTAKNIGLGQKGKAVKNKQARKSA